MTTRFTLLAVLASLATGCQEFTISGYDDAQGTPNPPGLTSPVWTDRVRQGIQPKVDILWVLDNSCSMSEEQDALASNLGAFFQHVAGAGLDWHMGVVTTDIEFNDGEPGELLSVAGYDIINRDTPFGEDLFANLVRVGTSGSGDERGLQSAFSALAKPNPSLIETNRGINRPNAALHVVVISDENDQSQVRPDSAGTGPWNGISPFEMANFLKSTKSDPEIPVTFNSIVGDEGGCRGPGGDAASGTFYREVTNQVGGLFFSICQEDWSETLNALGLLASGIRQEFWLSKVPVPGSVRVKVTDVGGKWRGFEERMDPADLPAICDDDEAPFCFTFRYDEFQNSLYFLDYTPSDLAQIEIVYEPLDSYVGEEPIGDW